MGRKADHIVAFNDQAIAKRARERATKQIEWKVEGVPGLSLVVKPTGAATYFVRYQIGNGRARQKRAGAIGRCGGGGLSLHDARKRASDIMNAVLNGGDPFGQAEAEKSA